MTDEELLRYAYIRSDRETLLERWPKQTEVRGYLPLLDAGGDPNRVPGPRERAWILARIALDPDLDLLLREGAHPNANPGKVRQSLEHRLARLKLTRPQIHYAHELFASRRNAA